MMTGSQRRSFDSMLMGQCIHQAGQIAYVVLRVGGSSRTYLLKTAGSTSNRNQLVNILGGEKVFMSSSIAFECENRSVDLRFKGNLGIEITPNCGLAGQTKSLVDLHWVNLGCFGESSSPLRSLTLHFPQVPSLHRRH